MYTKKIKIICCLCALLLQATETPPVVTQVQNEVECRSSSDASSESTGVHINCSCKLKNCDEDMNLALLTCHVCNTVQHAACYGITRESAGRVFRHCCVDCSDADKSRVPTDLRLAKTKDEQRRKLCLLRRIFDWCSQVVSVSVEDIIIKFQLRKDEAITVVRGFYKKGIIGKSPGNTLTDLHEIDQKQLKITISEYFKNDNSILVGKLIAETLSQEREDPVRDILKASDTGNLQTSKTSEILKPIDPIQTKNNNSTLKEYKDAIMTTDSFEDFKSPVNINKENISRLRKRKIPKKVVGPRKMIRTK